MSRNSANSGSVATAVIVLAILSWSWLGWRGFVAYSAGFFVGGVGTIINAKRRGFRY